MHTQPRRKPKRKKPNAAGLSTNVRIGKGDEEAALRFGTDNDWRCENKTLVKANYFGIPAQCTAGDA